MAQLLLQYQQLGHARLYHAALAKIGTNRFGQGFALQFQQALQPRQAILALCVRGVGLDQRGIALQLQQLLQSGIRWGGGHQTSSQTLPLSAVASMISSSARSSPAASAAAASSGRLLRSLR